MATAKKTTKKIDTGIDDLQLAIVTGLEDVKAVDVQVFDTEKQTSLFERVMIASGNSNRQTRALAMSVMDKVKEAGFPKPRVEGLENGEWIIVDCGMAVCHIMQPMIRAYYHLEDIWGEKIAKPVKAEKKASAKPKAKVKAKAEDKPSTAPKAKAKPAAEEESGSKKVATKTPKSKTLASSDPSKKVAVKKAPAKKAVARKVAAKKNAPESAAPAAKKVAAKKAPAKTVVAKKAPAKKAAK
jgi:ribosome-associated protein